MLSYSYSSLLTCTLEIPAPQIYNHPHTAGLQQDAAPQALDAATRVGGMEGGGGGAGLGSVPLKLIL